MTALVAASAVLPFVIAVLAPLEQAILGTWFLDVRRENNLPTWLSSAQFALAAVAALAAVGASTGVRRVAWLGVAALCLALSIDETASLHEEVGRRAGAEATLGLVQPVAALIVVLLLLVVGRIVAGAPARALRWATAALLASQVSASVGGLFASGTVLYAFEVLEETTEVLTAVLLLTAALLAAGVRLERRPRAVWAEVGRWWRPTPTVEQIDLTDASHSAPVGSRPPARPAR